MTPAACTLYMTILVRQACIT